MSRSQIIVVFLFLAAVIVGSCEGFDSRSNLSIDTGSNRLLLKVEVADTNEKRMLGLMHRQLLGPNEGMLFIFSEEAPRIFWMKNTYLSLDILFINAHREIIFVVPKTPPFSEEPISSHLPAQYVLEVNAGYAAKNGVRVGDKVIF